MDQDEDTTKHNANAALSRFFKTNRAEYDTGTVLVVYWEECEEEFKEEGQQVGAFFSNKFNYNVEYFEIPREDPELALDSRLNELLLKNKKNDCLLIIHYGGHGDDDDAQKRQLAWALNIEGDSPALSWSALQPKLRLHHSEVLVLLDCCFASQAARGSKSPIPENVELLVACGLNTKTVLPGKTSFTTHLLREIGASLEAEGSVKISTLHKNLASKEAGLGQSAIYYPLGNSKGSIVLQPLEKPICPTPPSPPESGSVILRLSLGRQNQDAIKKVLDEIVDWLKRNPPPIISNVKIIELLRDSAAAVQSYINDDSQRGKPVVPFNDLDTPACNDILSALSTFKNKAGRVASSLADSSVIFGALDTYLDEDASAVWAEELTTSFVPVQRAVERSVLTSAKLCRATAEDHLRQATSDPQFLALGLGEILNLKVLAYFPQGKDARKITIQLDVPVGLFPCREIRTLPDIPELGSVMIEAKRFEENVDLRVVKKRLERLSVLLQSDKSAEFQTLPCSGFFFEPPHAYGLIFGVPSNGLKLAVTLRELLSRECQKPKPSLDQRFQIAYKIGRALSKWHLVGWVHQGIASYNIVFFYNNDGSVDYTNPYLCGFEYARHEGAPSTARIVEQLELNVYRHPERQGVPNASHHKEHDIYSYGVLLLEIGLWDLAEELFRSQRKELAPHYMAKRLRKTVEKELGFHAGTSYQKATTLCLDTSLGVDVADNKIDLLLARSFEQDVLVEIKKGVSLGFIGHRFAVDKIGGSDL
ncbi:Protein kinase-like (PK-like) [Glarea lozoyensis ATCC 20868]|uniref:Protein kinase-like (PK-like) n=1 Tax=Glarea lozoyensis (strain ATCC 20868 / MF5171) TaxID=1116229 RepID=S3DYB2_GLAL2|nr:Protein kinase-like (PK-like) [Glarea lozoyensis ATCC 20868]EPE31318.1 Protein kinase-like (PK-like) [Glarea lozoyensis ATCC 20868]